jgi:hypothetical protein
MLGRCKITAGQVMGGNVQRMISGPVWIFAWQTEEALTVGISVSELRKFRTSSVWRNTNNSKAKTRYLKTYAIWQSNTTFCCTTYISEWYLKHNDNYTFLFSFFKLSSGRNSGYFNVQLTLLLCTRSRIHKSLYAILCFILYVISQRTKIYVNWNLIKL